MLVRIRIHTGRQGKNRNFRYFKWNVSLSRSSRFSKDHRVEKSTFFSFFALTTILGKPRIAGECIPAKGHRTDLWGYLIGIFLDISEGKQHIETSVVNKRRDSNNRTHTIIFVQMALY